MSTANNDRFYFKQLLAGRDFATHDPRAKMMENFVYVIGDRQTRECMLIDPAWGVQELVDLIHQDGFSLTGVLVTHYHPDHIGGSMFGFTVEGLPKLMEIAPCPVHVHHLEADGVKKVTGLSQSDLHCHHSGDKVSIGELEVELLHTPGHTPGSQCFCVQGSLLSGDTLFLQGCGRVDLPGGDVDDMYYTLTQRLASLPANMTLYPGHAYGGAHDSLSSVRTNNPYLQVKDLQHWRSLHQH